MQSESSLWQYKTRNGQSSVLGVSRKIDPFTVTAQQLDDFFIHLFEEKGYSPSTIKGYRSAISRTIAITGGSDFGQDEFLSFHIRNFILKGLGFNFMFHN